MIFLSPKVVLVKCGERPFLPAEVKEEVKEREEKGKKAKNPETVVAAWPGSPLLVTANSKYHVPMEWSLRLAWLHFKLFNLDEIFLPMD